MRNTVVVAPGGDDRLHADAPGGAEMLRGAFLATVALLSPCRTQVCAHAPSSSDHLAVITECVESAQGGVETLLGSIPGPVEISAGAWTLADGHRPDNNDQPVTIRRERNHSTQTTQIRRPLLT